MWTTHVCHRTQVRGTSIRKKKKKYRQQIVKYKVYTIRLVAVTLDSGESKAMGQGRVQTGRREMSHSVKRV